MFQRKLYRRICSLISGVKGLRVFTHIYSIRGELFFSAHKPPFFTTLFLSPSSTKLDHIHARFTLPTVCLLTLFTHSTSLSSGCTGLFTINLIFEENVKYLAHKGCGGGLKRKWQQISKTFNTHKNVEVVSVCNLGKAIKNWKQKPEINSGLNRICYMALQKSTKVMTPQKLNFQNYGIC